jgi:hypothetical protein
MTWNDTSKLLTEHKKDAFTLDAIVNLAGLDMQEAVTYYFLPIPSRLWL